MVCTSGTDNSIRALSHIPSQPMQRDPCRMRALMLSLLLAACLIWESQSVWVMVEDRSFPLDAVKILKNLLEANTTTTPLPPNNHMPVVCANPNLPAVFLPVCQGDAASIVFNRLVAIITPPDPCEICANVACTGCL